MSQQSPQEELAALLSQLQVAAGGGEMTEEHAAQAMAMVGLRHSRVLVKWTTLATYHQLLF
jgi:hypothetical protein